MLNMAAALRQAGHEPEVFVLSSMDGQDVVFNGIRVHRVAYRRTLLDYLVLRLGRVLTWKLWPVFRDAFCAWKLARALHRRQCQMGFDVIQSSNYGLTGWFVRKHPGQRHLVRISTSRVLYSGVDARPSLADRITERLDVRILQRADRAYAPSSYLANYFRNRYGLSVDVLRPPHLVASDPVETVPWALPSRFLVHFGNLGRRKGTYVLAEALLLAWKQEPGITMVWAGRESEPLMHRLQARWADRAEQVTWLGPIERNSLYAVVKRADAAVLPSLVDNLPNTVIESLMLDVPVIGSKGASIDELVEPGRNGELVPIGDATALSEALVRVWRREVAWLGTNFRPPVLFDAMQPAEAVRRFVALAHATQLSGSEQEACRQASDNSVSV